MQTCMEIHTSVFWLLMRTSDKMEMCKLPESSKGHSWMNFSSVENNSRFRRNCIKDRG